MTDDVAQQRVAGQERPERRCQANLAEVDSHSVGVTAQRCILTALERWLEVRTTEGKPANVRLNPPVSLPLGRLAQSRWETVPDWQTAGGSREQHHTRMLWIAQSESTRSLVAAHTFPLDSGRWRNDYGLQDS
jgi:hypothetical protein